MVRRGRKRKEREVGKTILNKNLKSLLIDLTHSMQIQEAQRRAMNRILGGGTTEAYEM